MPPRRNFRPSREGHLTDWPRRTAGLPTGSKNCCNRGLVLMSRLDLMCGLSTPTVAPDPLGPQPSIGVSGLPLKALQIRCSRRVFLVPPCEPVSGEKRPQTGAVHFDPCHRPAVATDVLNGRANRLTASVPAGGFRGASAERLGAFRRVYLTEPNSEGFSAGGADAKSVSVCDVLDAGRVRLPRLYGLGQGRGAKPQREGENGREVSGEKRAHD
jgi:hypothetical protein